MAPLAPQLQQVLGQEGRAPTQQVPCPCRLPCHCQENLSPLWVIPLPSLRSALLAITAFWPFQKPYLQTPGRAWPCRGATPTEEAPPGPQERDPHGLVLASGYSGPPPLQTHLVTTLWHRDEPAHQRSWLLSYAFKNTPELVWVERTQPPQPTRDANVCLEKPCCV